MGDKAAREMVEDYAQRLQHYCEFRLLPVRAEKVLDTHPRAYKVLLDAGGRQLSTAEFSALIQQAEQGPTRELLFFVGGPDGISPLVRQKGDLLLALSRLTLPHQLARVILAEQIYRAFTILRGHPYAR